MSNTTSTPQAVVWAALRQVAPDRAGEVDTVDIDIDVDVWRALDLDSLDHLTVMTALADNTNVDIAERDYPRLLTLRQLYAHVERVMS